MTNREAAIKIIKRLHSKGFQALLAGGCVRDKLLRRRAEDYDVATDAQPKDVIRLFRRTLKVGAKFGVVIVLIEDRQVEVATFRTEADYADGRRPAVVQFGSAAEDARRRDFTINGMFYDPIKKRLYDYVGGQKDLQRKVLRTIGKPDERLSEDYLRMLRAVRFSTQLGFAIESSTWTGICRNAQKISKISGERIAIELEGILANPNRAAGASILVESGLLHAIFTGLNARKAQIGIKVLSQLPKQVDFALALACLFVGCETEFAAGQYRVLKLSRNQNKHIKFLLANRDRLLDGRISLADLKKLLAGLYFWDLYKMQMAIQKADVRGAKGITVLKQLHRRIKALGDIDIKPRPLLNGRDLIRLGAVPGPALGQLIEELYAAQLEEHLQTPQQAEQWSKRWLHRHRVKNK